MNLTRGVRSTESNWELKSPVYKQQCGVFSLAVDHDGSISLEVRCQAFCLLRIFFPSFPSERGRWRHSAGGSELKVIKKSQTAQQSQRDMIACSAQINSQREREREIRYLSFSFSVFFPSSFDSLELGWESFVEKVLTFFSSPLHTVEIWLLLIRFSTALAGLI